MYAALAEWLDDHGYAVAGPVRERYLAGVADDVPPDLYRTELDRPVVPLPASGDGGGRRAPVGVGCVVRSSHRAGAMAPPTR